MRAGTSKADRPPTSKGGGSALMVGGLAAILASTCCLGPLILITVGLSGAWIGNLTALEPYRLVFIGVALAALFLARRRIWQSPTVCAPGEICALPQVKSRYRLLFWAVTLLVVIALAFPYAAPWFY